MRYPFRFSQEARLAGLVWSSCYLALAPLDTPAAARSFLEYWQPWAAIFVETELWQTLLEEARCANVPVALVNARASTHALAVPPCCSNALLT